MGKPKLTSIQKTKYLEIVMLLWEYGPEEANQEYPDVSIEDFETANEYYDTLRCPGCYCGSCVGLGDLSNDLPNSPAPLKPIAKLAMKLGQEEFDEL